MITEKNKHNFVAPDQAKEIIETIVINENTEEQQYKAENFEFPYVVTAEGRKKKCDYNICKYLKEQHLIDNVRYNEFSENFEINRNGSGYVRLIDSDLAMLRAKLHICEDFRGKDISRDTMFNCITATARRENPVLKYFQSLEWDGIPRAERIIIDTLGAEDTEYTRAATMVFLYGALARALNPGIKFDYMLVLQGGQSLGKTSFFQAIAVKPEWYGEIGSAHISDRKRLGEDAAGKIIVEYGELDGITKKSTGLLKATITSQNDEYRRSYDRLSDPHPRKYVIVGTTNKVAYLTDPTGNRRYLPISVTKKGFLTDDPTYPENVNQIWAEVYSNYAAGNYSLVLPDTVEQQANDARGQVTRLASDDFMQTVIDYVDQGTPGGKPLQYVTVMDIYRGYADRFPGINHNEARKIIEECLQRLGWTFCRNKRCKGKPYPISAAYWRPTAEGTD